MTLLVLRRAKDQAGVVTCGGLQSPDGPVLGGSGNCESTHSNSPTLVVNHYCYSSYRQSGHLLFKDASCGNCSCDLKFRVYT
jgi:hypothetical protein